jgi:hypothetical protein
MRRRKFIALLAGAASWPLAARAQPHERMRLVGVLMGYAESDQDAQANVAVFRHFARFWKRVPTPICCAR